LEFYAIGVLLGLLYTLLFPLVRPGKAQSLTEADRRGKIERMRRRIVGFCAL
jgi:hypothetical protein